MEENRVRTSDSLLTCADLLPVIIGIGKYIVLFWTQILKDEASYTRWLKYGSLFNFKRKIVKVYIQSYQQLAS